MVTTSLQLVKKIIYRPRAVKVAPTEETSGVYMRNETKEEPYPVYYYRGMINDNNCG